MTEKSTIENRDAYIVTGATSGIGRATAFELAKHGTVILVGRSRQKLDEMQQHITQRNQHALSVVCELSEPASVKKAAAEIIALQQPIAGIVNNAGMMQMSQPTKNSLGWDTTFATNHIGPFLFTEALMPHLADNTNVLFVVSAIEDPERPTVKVLKMPGARYISTEASARGEWAAAGSAPVGIVSYGTSKQCNLVAALKFAEENPRLRINAIEPGITPATNLGGRSNILVGLLFKYVVTFLPPFNKYRSTPALSAKVIAEKVTSQSTKTGAYYDQHGKPMLGSATVRDQKFQQRVMDETREFLAKNLHPNFANSN